MPGRRDATQNEPGGDPPSAGARANPVRLHAFLEGHVQGVGMRATVIGLADPHGVTGWVRNTPEGSVEILAEARREDLEDFLAAVRREMSHYIRNVPQSWEPATGEFADFTVRFR